MPETNQLPPNVIRYGTEADLPESRTLHAGPLSLVYQSGCVRFIRCGRTELIRGMYAAVRDHNWGTIEPDLQDEIIEDNGDSFSVTYRAVHRGGDISFDWQGTITGSADGTVDFLFDGVCGSTFRKNRIGFCLLHPMTCAGAPCTVTHTDDTVRDGNFPELISPHQPFKDIRSISWKAGDISAKINFEGDTFEMEDQRNWTDASYKTYCTPLADPFPVTVKEGECIRQKITLSVSGCLQPAVDSSAPDSISVSMDPERETPFPEIGLEKNDGHLSEMDAALLAELHPGHLRVELHPESLEQLKKDLDHAARQAGQLKTHLLAAIFFDENPEQEIRNLEQAISNSVMPVKSILVFRNGEKSTTRQTMETVAPRLRVLFSGCPVGTGTDAFFTELNREHPPTDTADFVSYSLNPQVHAFDNISLAETLPAQGVTVQTARAFAPGKPVHVSPVSLKIRRNPNATGPEPPLAPGELPSQADERQMSLFAAGWTLGSIKYLAEAGAASVTFYRTTGIRGVLMPEDSPGHPAFPAGPGTTFPLYHILAAAGKAADGAVIPCSASDPLSVSVLVYRTADGSLRCMAANHTGLPQTIQIPWGDNAQVRQLDNHNAEAVMKNPEAFSGMAAENIPLQDDRIRLMLNPYGISFIE